MKSLFRYFLYAVCYGAMAALLVSCAGKATVKGFLDGAPEADVVVKLLNVNQFQVLDTVKTDASGSFSYKMAVEKGQPEFVYLFYKDTRIASLLLKRGDAVTVEADTLGQYSITGSEESEKLRQVEKDLEDFTRSFADISTSLARISPESPLADSLRKDLGKLYVEYYRGRLRYVMTNPYSMTSVPVLFQTVGNMPVFGQQTDAIHFSSICDSLAKVYPDSRYVKALRQEADRRFKAMELAAKLQKAEEVDYLDIEMPDVNGVKKKLSEVDAKVVVLHFWAPSQPVQKMYNIEVLKPLYEKYSDKGLEIYQVAIDTDKAGWARIVKEQNLDWINVCDGLGEASPVVVSYNLSVLPATFILSGGTLQKDRISDDSSLRAAVSRLLK